MIMTNFGSLCDISPQQFKGINLCESIIFLAECYIEGVSVLGKLLLIMNKAIY